MFAPSGRISWRAWNSDRRHAASLRGGSPADAKGPNRVRKSPLEIAERRDDPCGEGLLCHGLSDAATAVREATWKTCPPNS
jgi:hypothetical protein